MQSQIEVLKPLTAIVETKISRAEMMDIIIEDLVQELNDQLDALKKKDDLLPEDEEFHDAFFAMMPKKPEITTYRYSNGTIAVTVKFDVQTKNAPAAYRNALKQREETREARRVLNEKRDTLTKNRQKAKNEIIRRSLEESKEGRAILETIESFKLGLKQKLLK